MGNVKTVYFVRHGQSVDNISPVFQGEDSDLSEDGIRQADFIAKRVSHLQFDKLISQVPCQGQSKQLLRYRKQLDML